MSKSPALKITAVVILLSLLLSTALLFTCCGGTKVLVFTPDKLPDANKGEQYTVTVAISHNPTPVASFTITDGALPTGLELKHNQADDQAIIIGTPASAGTFTFTLKATCFATNNPGRTGYHEYSITVK